MLADVEFPYHWGGPLGVPRDWRAGVRFDRAAGLAVAGGYVGDGVSTTNLAGRTLADLITGRDTELTRLPWVGHRSRSAGSPSRCAGSGSTSAGLAAARADDAEASTARSARWRAAAWQRVLGALTGH